MREKKLPGVSEEDGTTGLHYIVAVKSARFRSKRRDKGSGMRDIFSDTLTDAAKWAAVAASDARYDGSFFYGVSTTKIFCRPSCTAKRPLREHVRFFARPQEALAAGFRPCKKCRPDQARYDPGRDVVEKAKAVFAETFDTPQALRDRMAALPVSANHLMRLFKEYEGCTQSRYLASLRVAKARKLLAETTMPIMQVALESGFASPSSFYKRFAELAGVSPAQYRKAQGEKS